MLLLATRGPRPGRRIGRGVRRGLSDRVRIVCASAVEEHAAGDVLDPGSSFVDGRQKIIGRSRRAAVGDIRSSSPVVFRSADGHTNREMYSQFHGLGGLPSVASFSPVEPFGSGNATGGVCCQS